MERHCHKEKKNLLLVFSRTSTGPLHSLDTGNRLRSRGEVSGERKNKTNVPSGFSRTVRLTVIAFRREKKKTKKK